MTTKAGEREIPPACSELRKHVIRSDGQLTIAVHQYTPPLRYSLIDEELRPRVVRRLSFSFYNLEGYLTEETHELGFALHYLRRLA